MVDRRLEARAYTRIDGQDDPEIRDWTWPYQRPRKDRSR
jgi:xylulose-5-phosphate/fructose-6-phosphate phosphoketolase